MNTNTKTQTIAKYVQFEGIVRFSDIQIDPEAMTFSLLLQTKKKGGSRFSNAREVSGQITYELKSWLTNMYRDLVRVEDEGSERGFKYMRTGKTCSGLTRFLFRIGKEFKPNVLSELTLESDAWSEKYDENPFRLVMLKDRCILTMVNFPPKRRVEVVDYNTGEVSFKYIAREFITKNGRQVPKSTPPEQFRRLIVEGMENVEVISNY